MFSPGTGFPFASVTVAATMAVELPLPGMELGEIFSSIVVAGPGVWVKVVLALLGGEVDVSVAVIVGRPAVLELVSVAL